METAKDKLQWLSESQIELLDFDLVSPDKHHNWINQNENAWEELISLVDKDVKSGKNENAIFKLFSRGIATQRDEWVYDFSKVFLETKMKSFINVYRTAIENSKADFQIKWDRELSKYLKNKIPKRFEKDRIVLTQYRPFIKEYFYFDKHFNGQPYQWFEIFRIEDKNQFIAINSPGNPKDFFCMSANTICDLHLTGDSQCLPLYRYTSTGERIDNITDWGLQQFKDYYKNGSITKEDIFHYTYAVLHNPAYRKKYELNLKKEFPRIPFYDDFYKWVKWGEQLMNLHINYETVEPFPLKQTDAPPALERSRNKVKLKADKQAGVIDIDERTILSAIPKEAWEYKLGNRSALEWILDQYKEKKPGDPTIAEKFNTYKFADYKEHVIDLLKRVCTVSVLTMKIVREMEEVNI